ncbi:reverse transcriptase domain-containing protein [Artemisia annua]|uniref:Reverse transcriptase domain-containing protein n=1 Tax=Artemisia annua TaxID=35608 RepID=A0A2U1N707_ARTAN|nr:reverse transcriptase domain-containing protein [Artemisia annua]
MKCYVNPFFKYQDPNGNAGSLGFKYLDMDDNDDDNIFPLWCVVRMIEIVILKSMIDFRSDMGDFYDFVKKSLRVKFSIGQLIDKGNTSNGKCNVVCTSTNGVDKKEVKEMNVNQFVKYSGNSDGAVLVEEIVKGGLELVEGMKREELEEKWKKSSFGVKLLRGAVSRDANFISRLAIRRAANAVDLMSLLSQLHDPQSEFILLRSCMGIAKLFFGLRICQPVHMEDATLFFDKRLRWSIENILVCGGPFFGDL